MISERNPLDQYGHGDYEATAVMSRYPDLLYLDGSQIGDDLRVGLRTAEHTHVTENLEPTSVGEPRTPSWSYENNPLFAALPANVEARLEQERLTGENTLLYDAIKSQSASDRLVQRVQEQTTRTPEVHRSVYHQLQAEQSPVNPISLMGQGLQATEAFAPEPQTQTEFAYTQEEQTHNATYGSPVPLWNAPRRIADNNVGVESQFVRMPLADSLTPRLEEQRGAQRSRAAAAYAARHAFDETAQAAEAHIAPAYEQEQPAAITPTQAFLSRLETQATSAAPISSETTQVISAEQLAATVASEQRTVATAAGEQLATRITAEATVATLEQKPAKTIRSYGQTLLAAAGFRFRMKRDETGEGYHGEIVDSDGTVQIDKIDMSKNAEGERMRTTRRLIGRMARLGMRIPKLPEPRIA